MSLLLTLSGVEQVLALINAANSQNFGPDSLVLGSPITIPDAGLGNTRIHVAANRSVLDIPGEDYLNYWRRPIDQLVEDDYRTLRVSSPVDSTWDLIPYLNEQLGMEFTEQDIIDEPVDNSVLPVNFTLKITPVSYGWTGAVPMVISAHLADLITVTDLPGIPLPMTPVAEQGTATLSNNGALWAGTGILTSKLMSATNGEIEVILGAHRRAVAGQAGYQTLFDPDSNGDYQFPLDNDKFWNWSFQVGLVDTDRHDRLTDAYAITMDVTHGEDTLRFDFVYTGGIPEVPTSAMFAWLATGQNPIVDSKPQTSEIISANSQQTRWYATAFPGAQVNGVNAHLGVWTITITATPIKCAVVKPVVLTTTVTVTASA